MLNPLRHQLSKLKVLNPKGTYLLIIELKKPREIEVGKLGVFFFPRGYYTYTGSAMGGIYQRIKRHFKRKKRLRWHIDYFLRYGKIREVVISESKNKTECEINQKIATIFGRRIIAPGLGAGDCRKGCGSHLLGIRKYGFHYIERQLKQVLSEGFPPSLPIIFT